MPTATELQATCVILEIDPRAVPELSTIVVSLRKLRPDMYLLGYCSAASNAGAAIIQVAKCGLDDLAFHDDAGSAAQVRRAVDSVDAERHERNASELIARLKTHVHGIAFPVAEYVVVHRREGPNLDLVARGLGCSARAVQRRFLHAGVAGPHDLIRLVRILCVARAISYCGMTVSQAAAANGFPCADALRTTLRRSARLTVSAMRDESCFELLFGRVATQFGHHPTREELARLIL